MRKSSIYHFHKINGEPFISSWLCVVFFCISQLYFPVVYCPTHTHTHTRSFTPPSSAIKIPTPPQLCQTTSDRLYYDQMLWCAWPASYITCKFTIFNDALMHILRWGLCKSTARKKKKKDRKNISDGSKLKCLAWCSVSPALLKSIQTFSYH